MIETNLAVDFSDLMDEEEKKDATAKTMLTTIKRIVEEGILSSLEDANVEGRRFINGATQRKSDRILDMLEDSEDGKLMMSDKQTVMFQEMWTNRLVTASSGQRRKLIQRIDRRICPDVYKEGK